MESQLQYQTANITGDSTPAFHSNPGVEASTVSRDCLFVVQFPSVFGGADRMDKEIHLDSHYLVEKFGLLPHPEGGFYKETYRSNDVVTTKRDCNEEIQRFSSTAIYFLIVPDSVSRLHRIKSDEGTAELRSIFNKSNPNPPIFCLNSLAFLFGR